MPNLSILIIDLENNLNKRIENILKKTFNTIFFADNEDNALKTYNLHCPDIVFTDMNSTCYSNSKLITKIKKNYGTIVILPEFKTLENLLETIKNHLLNYTMNKYQIQNTTKIQLNSEYRWDKQEKILFYYNKIVNLTYYETLLIDKLISTPNFCVSYEDIDYHVYSDSEFSKNSLTSLIKRLRKKIPSILIKSCYRQGYKIVI